MHPLEATFVYPAMSFAPQPRQISKLLGAVVVAVVSSPEKAAFLRGQGADTVIDSSTATPETPLARLIKKAAPKGEQQWLHCSTQTHAASLWNPELFVRITAGVVYVTPKLAFSGTPK